MACAHCTAISVGRKVLVPRTQEISTALQFRIEVDHLHDPVHTGIGSPGAHRRYGLRGKTGQGMLQLVLNGLA
jgi:hypothetical protein